MNFKNGCIKEMFLFGIVLFYIWLVYVKYGDFIELNRGLYKKLKGL